MKPLLVASALSVPKSKLVYGLTTVVEYAQLRRLVGKTWLCILLISLCCVSVGVGQLAFTSQTGAGALVTEDFTGFDGSGFSPTPSAGQLNSSEWRVRRLSDGNTGWGDTATTGDFARGSSPGGINAGGIYGFDVDNGAGVNRALGVQATNGDFTWGRMDWRINNNTGDTIDTLDIAYDIYLNNDQNRVSSFNFSFVDDDGATLVSSLDYTTLGTADANGWIQVSMNATLDVNLGDGNNILFRWRGDDVSGNGRRDEIALDNLSAEVIPEPSTYAIFIGILAMAIVAIKKRRELSQA
jgi:hypothetical protein